MYPDWVKLADSQTYGIVIAEVDCLHDYETCKGQGITGVPTLKMFFNGKYKEDYYGGREYPNLIKYVDEFSKTMTSEQKLLNIGIKPLEKPNEEDQSQQGQQEQQKQAEDQQSNQQSTNNSSNMQNSTNNQAQDKNTKQNSNFDENNLESQEEQFEQGYCDINEEDSDCDDDNSTVDNSTTYQMKDNGWAFRTK